MKGSRYAGDDVIPDAVMVYDHYRTIAGSANEIFPWIVQLGKARGGWYLRSRWERLLPRSWGASRKIEETYQNLGVGDRVPDYGSKHDYFEVVQLDHPCTLVYESLRYRTKFTWAILLEEKDLRTDGKKVETVVHLRFRGRIASTGFKRKVIVWSGGLVDYLTTAPMLAGLAERVEKPHSP